MSKMPDLDPASMILGELKGQFNGLEKYIHDQFHAANNKTQVQFNFLESILKEVRDLQANDQVVNTTAHQNLEARIEALEARDHRREGVRGALDWIFSSPIIGWIAAVAAFVWGFLTKRIDL